MDSVEIGTAGRLETAGEAAAARKCGTHPARSAVSVCVDCGRPFCGECVYDWEGDAICRSCIREYRAEENYLEKIETPAEKEWQPSSILTYRMFQTILLRPGRFFATMPRGTGIGEPLFFAFIWGILLMVLSAPANYLTIVFVAWKASLFGPLAEHLGAAEWVDRGFWKFLGAMPAYTMLSVTALFMTAALQHLLLLAFRRRSDFEATLRIAFFSIAGQALAILPIPLAAMLAAEVYTLVLQALGFRKVYGIRTVAAAALAIVPYAMIIILLNGLGGG